MVETPRSDADKTGTRGALDAAPPPSRGVGLSGRLLLLTIVFVMIAEVLIFVPSIANYRNNWLDDRLAAARMAALVIEAAPSGMAPEPLVRELLESAGAQVIVLKTGPARRLLAVAETPPMVDLTIDMRTGSFLRAIPESFGTLLASTERLVRVIGTARRDGEYVEIVIDETPLRAALLAFAGNILVLSLMISGITAALVYLSLHLLLVRPMRRLTDRMVAFRRAPEDPNLIVAPSGRKDEVGVAEHELRTMQRSIQDMLAQRARLAALGLAVSKISHDLRNMLASAHLFSDRLAGVPDPTVQRFAPKMIQALDRAIALCQSSLSYGRVQEAPPQRREVVLHDLVEETLELVGVGASPQIAFVNETPPELVVDADPDQLFRVLTNLARNARQALEQRGPARADRIVISARREGAVTVIDVADTGPGLPQKARDHLFEAFQGSARPGGTGLGLAIAAELLRAHGGSITLVDQPVGALFRLSIPDRPIDLASVRRAHKKRA